MMIFILMTTFALGFSESIEQNLPQDPNQIYTVAFEYNGVNVGIDWKNREIVPAAVCREAQTTERAQCAKAAIEWLRAECAWYSEKGSLSVTQEDMQYAVCLGADALSDLALTHQLADR